MLWTGFDVNKIRWDWYHLLGLSFELLLTRDKGINASEIWKFSNLKISVLSDVISNGTSDNEFIT